MELKDRILKTTYDKMLQLGISSLTMDMIASECGISKRTLYEQFSDKRTLMFEAMMKKHEEREAEFTNIIETSENKLEAMLGIYLLMRKYLDSVSDVYFSDIKRLYPELESEYLKLEKCHTREFSKMLEEGQREGVYRKDVNMQIITVLFFEEMQQVKTKMYKFPAGTSIQEVYDTGFVNFHRGIASQKGMEIIDTFWAKHKIGI